MILYKELTIILMIAGMVNLRIKELTFCVASGFCCSVCIRKLPSVIRYVSQLIRAIISKIPRTNFLWSNIQYNNTPLLFFPV